MQGYCEEFANGTKKIIKEKIRFEGKDGRTYEAYSREICRALVKWKQNLDIF